MPRRSGSSSNSQDSPPNHVAIIMDGNGRWAAQRGLSRSDGHRAGEEALLDTVEGALQIGLSYLTVYAFSTENWRRPREEVEFLMSFNEELLMRRRDYLHERGVRIRFVGRHGPPVPSRILKRMQQTQTMTEQNRKMTLGVAFNYGGRAEIVEASNRSRGRQTEASFSRLLYDPVFPEVDLLIRTSGEQRLSNFLLWQVAYAELYFTPVLWPDFRRFDLGQAVQDYQRRGRRFGGIEVAEDLP